MKNVDPGSLFAFFAILMFAGIFDAPLLIFMFVIFMVIRTASVNKNKNQENRNRRSNPRESNRREQRDYRRQGRDQEYRRKTAPQRPRQQPTRKARPKNNPFKDSGLAKYRDYEYDGAIEDFVKALQINPDDIAVHFNLACAYSLTEDQDKSYQHLSKAVKLGFSDFEKIKTHDALAFIRIQDEFDPFVQGGYKWPMNAQSTTETGNVVENTDLLEQLNKLGELREKGLLTEEEFVLQKKKLLG